MSAVGQGRESVIEFCHRCGSELAAREWAGEGGFFCPHCGAPQILLPEHMRAENSPEPTAATVAGTSGVLAPPTPREIHWRTAIRYGALVAAIGGVLCGAGVVSSLASFLGFLWVVSGGVIALAFYQKHKPAAKMNVRVGFRIGVATGVMMTAALALALATAGVVARFGLHRMSEVDSQMVAFQTQMMEKMQEQKQNPEVQAEAIKLLRSPEVRGGVAVVYLGVLGAVLLVLSAGGGAFAGMLRSRQQGARSVL